MYSFDKILHNILGWNIMHIQLNINTEESTYKQIVSETIDQLVIEFYQKLDADPNLIPIFDGDINEIMRKQRMFLTQFTGGPPLYSQEFGRPAMQSRHLPHEINPDKSTKLVTVYERGI